MTIDIDEKRLGEIQRLTGIEKKSPAVAKALEEYCREEKKKKFLHKVMEGHTDYPLTNDELENLAEYDPD